MREVAPVSEPDNCAITRSTGPPGANCTTAKATTIIPSKVGIIEQNPANDVSAHKFSANPALAVRPVRELFAGISPSQHRHHRDMAGPDKPNRAGKRLSDPLRFGCLVPVVPPSFQHTARIAQFARGCPKTSQYADAVRCFVPLRNPVSSGAEQAVERATGGDQRPAGCWAGMDLSIIASIAGSATPGEGYKPGCAAAAAEK